MNLKIKLNLSVLNCICLGLCSLLFIYSVGADTCGVREHCTLKNWVTTDCKPCCQQGADPMSAVQKRVLCCPNPANGSLPICVQMCNFTLSQYEQRGSCVGLCPRKCSGGFHFRTTSTSTTTSTTTPTSTTPTTTSTTTTTPTTTSTTTTPTTTSTTTTIPTTTSTTTPTTTSTTTTTPTTTRTTTTTPTTTSTTTTTPTTTTPTTTPTTTSTTTTPTTTSTTTTMPTTTSTTTTTPTTTSTTTTPTTTTQTTTTTMMTSTTTPTTTTTTPTTTTSTSTIAPSTTDNGLHVVFVSPTMASPTPKPVSYSDNSITGTMTNAPLLISLPLVGLVVGSLLTLLVFWLVKRRKGKVTSEPKTPVRPQPMGPNFDPTYDRTIERQGFNIRNGNGNPGYGEASTGLGDNLSF